MRARFLHMADCHLGYRQYNLRERFNDFGRAFFGAINTAIEAEVDFVLLAGDLFNKRAIDALTLNQAVAALERLKRAGIPCIAVEGNHEHAYVDDFIGWMKFLALREYLVLLDSDFKEGVPQLTSYQRSGGSYIEPVEGLRIYGLRYMGAGTRTAVKNYADAIAKLPTDKVEYTIFMTHAGIEGVVNEQMGGLSMGDWAPLRNLADYVALGHIHKPYEREEWIYNPGSLETCAALEAQWTERGYYIVDVDTNRTSDQTGESKHRATLHANPRRRFVRLSFKTDLNEDPEQLYSQLQTMLTRRARDLGIDKLAEDARPVVDLNLFGVLQFDRADLSVSHIEEMVRTVFTPMHLIVRNQTRSNDLAIEAGETINRRQLERRVLADLFGRDARYRAQGERWAQVAIGLKNLAAEGTPAEAIVDELTAQIDRLDKVGDEVDSETVADGDSTQNQEADVANPVD